MKTCLLTCHSVPTETDTLRSTELNYELATVTAPNHMAYARRHSYSQHILRVPWKECNPGKLVHLKAILPQFDVVVTHGSDVLFMNQSVTVDEVCFKAGHKSGVMFAREAHTDWPLNNDVGIWFNDERSHKILDRLIATWETWQDYPYLWQSQVWNLIQTDKEMAACVTLTNPRMMNASPGGDNEARWKIGDWVCHFLGHDENTKVAVAHRMLKKCSADGAYYPPAAVFNRIKRTTTRDPKAVIIAMPTYNGEARVETMQCLMAFMMWAGRNMPDWIFSPAHLAGTGVPKLRDYLVHLALEAKTPEGKGFGRIFFWDSDVAALPEQLQRILTHKHPVVGGLYPLKKKGLAWVWLPMQGLGPMPNGLQSVAGVGTGFKSFDLCLFEAFAETHPELEYTCTDLDPRFAGKKMTMFFREDVVEGNRMPEDYYFDRQTMLMGLPVYADTTVRLGHIGHADYLQFNAHQS